VKKITSSKQNRTILEISNPSSSNSFTSPRSPANSPPPNIQSSPSATKRPQNSIRFSRLPSRIHLVLHDACKHTYISHYRVSNHQLLSTHDTFFFAPQNPTVPIQPAYNNQIQSFIPLAQIYYNSSDHRIDLRCLSSFLPPVAKMWASLSPDMSKWLFLIIW
jgi:hypothetical protein